MPRMSKGKADLEAELDEANDCIEELETELDTLGVDREYIAAEEVADEV